MKRWLIPAMLLLTVLGCADESSRDFSGAKAIATDKPVDMRDTLRRTLDSVLALPHRYLNDLVAANMEKELPQHADDPRFLEELGKNHMRAGNLQRAREIGEQLLAWPGFPPEALRRVRFFKAFLELRDGELTNCLHNHSHESCIFPIAGSGVYVDQTGPKKAAELFEAYLEDFPDDTSARWLLNVAHMTMGSFPEGVPPRFRIDARRFRNRYGSPRFYDVAAEAGVDHRSLAGGVVLEDFDADGLLDILVSSAGERDPMKYFRNEGNGRFSDQTQYADLAGQFGGLNMVHADYDNDGDADVLVLRGAWITLGGKQPNSLLENIGGGVFVDKTIQAGLLSYHPTQVGAWADFNGDGWLDLYVGNESIGEYQHAPELFQSNGDGTFTNVAAAAGITHKGMLKGAAWGDYDNDGRPDLYVSRFRETNLLYHNEGPDANGQTKFKEVAQSAGVALPVNSFPTWFWDFNNDGWLDIFVSNYSLRDKSQALQNAFYPIQMPPEEQAGIYLNKGDGTFENVAASAGFGSLYETMGCNYGDLNNDGWEDFYLGTGATPLTVIIPNRMFVSDRGKKFNEVTYEGGFGHLQKGHGIAFGDIDNDGDQDVYAVMGGAFSSDVFQNVLFENPGNEHHWLKLRLEGVRSNRSAIGARLRLVLEENGQRREIHRLIGSGGSFGAQTLRAEIGLGKATQVDTLEIVWPVADSRQVWTGIAADQALKVVEGQDEVEVLALPRFDFPAPGTAKHDHSKMQH